MNSTKDLNYYKNNCEEDYIKTPISVLRYITELEQALQLQQAGVMPRFISLVTSFDFNSINEKINWLNIKREDIISIQHTKNDGFCLYYFKNEV